MPLQRRKHKVKHSPVERIHLTYIRVDINGGDGRAVFVPQGGGHVICRCIQFIERQRCVGMSRPVR